MQSAFKVQANLSEIDYSGKTDRKIAHILHEHYNLPVSESSIDKFLAAYIAHLEVEMQHTRMHVIEHIVEVLELIDQNPMFHQGLLTGNLRAGANIKLGHFGIYDYFRFGATSDFAVERNELGPYALTEARRDTGILFSPENVFVIGDTPHDIACGKIINAKTVAIATGRYSLESLAEHQPDFAMERITAPDDFLMELLDLEAVH